MTGVRWWVPAILNTLLLPLYFIEVLNALQVQFIAGAFGAFVIVAGVSVAWARVPRVAAVFQLVLIGVTLAGTLGPAAPVNTAGLSMSDFLDWRVVVSLLLTVLVPALLSAIALIAIFHRGKVLPRRRFLLAAALISLTTACRKPDPVHLQRDLQCAMSRADAERIARQHGYAECSAPTEKEGTPDSSCSAGGRGVAFWFDERGGLSAYQLWDAEADDCPDPAQESGCASERIDLCRGFTAEALRAQRGTEIYESSSPSHSAFSAPLR